MPIHGRAAFKKSLTHVEYGINTVDSLEKVGVNIVNIDIKQAMKNKIAFILSFPFNTLSHIAIFESLSLKIDKSISISFFLRK